MTKGILPGDIDVPNGRTSFPISSFGAHQRSSYDICRMRKILVMFSRFAAADVRQSDHAVPGFTRQSDVRNYAHIVHEYGFMIEDTMYGKMRCFQGR